MKHLRKPALLFAILALLLALPITAAQSAAADGKTFTVDAMASSAGEAGFRLLIKNDDSRPHIFSLANGTPANGTPDNGTPANGTPDNGTPANGLQEEFSLDGKAVSDVEVKAQDSVIIDMKVKLPADFPAGTTMIDIQATRDDGQVFLLPVSVTVNHDYSLLITNRISGLSVINGQDLSFDVAISNNGSKSLDKIKLSLELPYKWMLQGTNPGELSLKPGESGSYQVKVSVPPSQTSGNNTIKVSATTDAAASPKVEIPVAVQNNPGNLFWVAGIILLAGAGTLLYFRKHGRR